MPIRLRIPLVACCAALIVFASACDIPSEAPSFTVNPTVKTPIVFSEGLLFLGPGPAGEPALIDSTSPDFDSLFTVNPGDNSVYIIREVDRIDLDSDVSLFEPVTVGPTAFSAAIGDFGSRQVTGSLARTVGIQDGDARTSPTVPRMMQGNEVYFPGSVDSVLSDPSSDLLTLSTSSVSVFGFSPDGAPLNQLTVRMTNNSGQTLTDGTFAPGTIPVVELVEGTQVYATAQFNFAPNDGQTAVAVVDLAGRLLPAGARLRLNVGTASGIAPIRDNFLSLGLVASASATRYDSFVFRSISPQNDVDVTESFGLADANSFSGIVVSSGSVTLDVNNSLPLDFQINSLRLENETAFGPYPAGHTFATTSGNQIAANATTRLTIPIGNEGISADTRIVASLSSPGNPNEVLLSASDGLIINVVADLDVVEVYLYPTGEVFTDTGSMSFTFDEIQLEQSTDFVELASGTLTLQNVMNGYGVGIDEITISFPGIRSAPYDPGDSLVVTLTGMGPSSGPHQTSMDLAGTRIFATGGTIAYNVRAVTEQTNAERSLAETQSFSGEALAENLVPSQLTATIEPFSVSVTADANGDDLLDVLSDDEAQVVTIDGLDEFYDFGLEGLDLVGAELSLEVTTDIGADIELFGTLAGVRRSGEIVYLQGLSQNAVSPSDSLSGNFAAGGLPIDPAQLVKMSISGDAAGKVVTRRIVFDDNNSNVGAFIANLPEEVRMVAQAVIGREDGRVVLSDPFVLAADVSLMMPLALRGQLNVRHEFDADMSSLDQLTDPNASVEVNVAELALEYTNEIPFGVNAVFRFLDAGGQETIVLPTPEDPAVSFGAAQTDAAGFATGSTNGRVTFPLDDDRLRALARSRSVSLELLVNTGGNNIGRVRANDLVTFAMSGNFDIRITVGD